MASQGCLPSPTENQAMIKLAEPMVKRDKELQSFVDKYSEKHKNTRIYTSKLLSLVNTILKSYISFLLDLIPNSLGFYRPEE